MKAETLLHITTSSYLENFDKMGLAIIQVYLDKLRGDPKRLWIVIFLWRIEKRLNETNEIIN